MADAGDARVAGAVRQAYQRLRRSTGLRNVSLAALLDESGVEVAALHAYLLGECEARRANPTRGDLTVASAAERAAALPWDGELHVFVELYEEAQ